MGAQNGQATHRSKQTQDKEKYQSVVHVQVGVKMDLQLAGCADPKLDLLKSTLERCLKHIPWGDGQIPIKETSTVGQSVFFPMIEESVAIIDSVHEKERSVDDVARLLKEKAEQLFHPDKESIVQKIREQTKQQLPNVVSTELAVRFSGSLLGNSFSVKR